MNLVERVKAILLQPKSEWPVIEREPGDAGYLFTNYVFIISAIPPVCAFIGTAILGLGIASGLAYAVVTYVLGLAGVFVMAYVIDFLAGVFGAQKNFNSALKVAAYAPTAAWIVGVFDLVPFLGVLSVLGLYSLYLLHTGIAALMKPPADKALIYTIAVVVCVFVVYLVGFGILGGLFGMHALM